jgi:hypothetical protein
MSSAISHDFLKPITIDTLLENDLVVGLLLLGLANSHQNQPQLQSNHSRKRSGKKEFRIAGSCESHRRKHQKCYEDCPERLKKAYLKISRRRKILVQ